MQRQLFTSSDTFAIGCINNDIFHPISKWLMYNILDSLQPTSTGLDNIAAWFLRIGPPFFAAPLAENQNQSLFALQTLQQHVLPNDALSEVFQAVVINRLT